MGTLHKCVCINQCPAFLYGTGATPLISRLRQVTMVTLVAERSLTQTPYRLASSYHAWKNATSGIFGEINPALKTNTRPQKMDICSSLPGHVRLKNTLTKPREMFGSSSGSQPTVGAGESQSGSSITQQTNPETFGNYQLAYSSKSVAELLRMLSFFFLCRFSFFTEHAIKVCLHIRHPAYLSVDVDVKSVMAPYFFKVYVFVYLSISSACPVISFTLSVIPSFNQCSLLSLVSHHICLRQRLLCMLTLSVLMSFTFRFYLC